MVRYLQVETCKYLTMAADSGNGRIYLRRKSGNGKKSYKDTRQS